jgi:transposase
LKSAYQLLDDFCLKAFFLLSIKVAQIAQLTLMFYKTNIIKLTDSEIKDVSKKIMTLAKEDEMTSLLMTIPGIGYYSALLIVSEIGDINRFPDSYHLCSCWIGTINT